MVDLELLLARIMARMMASIMANPGNWVIICICILLSCYFYAPQVSELVRLCINLIISLAFAVLFMVRDFVKVLLQWREARRLSFP